MTAPSPRAGELFDALLSGEPAAEVALALVGHADVGDRVLQQLLEAQRTDLATELVAARRHEYERCVEHRLHEVRANADPATMEALRRQLDAAPEISAEAIATVATPVGLLDWADFWANDRRTEDWTAEPLLPRGRSTALFAPAKVGKSLLALEVASALATGRPIFGNTATTPAHVLYLDYEMTAADLRERLEDFGYGPGDDLTRLHYALLPSLPPLDTAAGADELVELVTAVGAEVVFIDTTGRAVQGDENSADTYRDYYRHTGIALKTLGLTVLRTDHAGKAPELGQRGSSAKNDDVDLVWRLDRTDEGYKLTRTHSRIGPWVPAQVVLRQFSDPHLAHVIAPTSWPAGTAQVAQMLDDAGVPLDAGRPAAQKALKARFGAGKSNDLVSAGLSWRRHTPRTGPRTAL